MPPFGTCFQSKVGSGYALRGGHARHSQAGYLSDHVHCGLACIALARAMPAPSGAVISFGLRLHGRNGGNNDMEGAAERRLSVGPAARTSLSHVTSTSFEFCRSAPR